MGFLFLILYPGFFPTSPPPPPASVTLSTNTHHLSHTTLSHIISHIFFQTHNFVTHHLSHTTLSYTTLSPLSHIICHTSSHTSSFAHNFVTHHLSHTTLSHIIFHTQLVTHHLTHHLSHTTLSHILFHTQLCHTSSPTSSFTHNFVTHHLQHLLSHAALSHIIYLRLAALCVAGVALGDIHLRFAGQASHLRHWAGSGGALGSD